MPIDFPNQVYNPNFNVFARVVTITPIASRPGELPYPARGIFDTDQLNVAAADDTILSDQRTILDILETEFTILPMQRDLIEIPADSGLPDQGIWEVIDKSSNGGGETTLTLRKIMRTDP